MTFFAQYGMMRIDAHPMRIGRCIRMANPSLRPGSKLLAFFTPFPANECKKAGGVEIKMAD